MVIFAKFMMVFSMGILIRDESSGLTINRDMLTAKQSESHYAAAVRVLLGQPRRSGAQPTRRSVRRGTRYARA
jgi:hypothetical protein